MTAKQKTIRPVRWVKKKGPELCIACSMPFKAKDMIFRLTCTSIHATRECVKRYKDDETEFSES